MKRAEKAFNDLLRNNNVTFNKLTDIYQPLHVSICSYDIDLITHNTYVQKIFNKVISAKEVIKEYFHLTKNQSFIFSIWDYNIDGLDETNSNLIARNSIVECNY